MCGQACRSVVVPVLGAASNEGETLFSAVWPAGLCFIDLGAVDTPAVGLSLGPGGNPRKAERLLLSVLRGASVILNAQELYYWSALRTPIGSLSTQTRRETNDQILRPLNSLGAAKHRRIAGFGD